MKIRIAGLSLLASLFLLTACGQKGPLYLEKEPKSAAAAEVEKDAVAGKAEENADKEASPEAKD